MAINPRAQDGASKRANGYLILAVGLVRQIESLAETGYPDEACGLLIGKTVRGQTRVEHVTYARNLNETRARDRYRLDPDDFLRAGQRAERIGLDVVGIWHSHPDHPSVPSQTDLDAAWPGYSVALSRCRRASVSRSSSMAQ